MSSKVFFVVMTMEESGILTKTVRFRKAEETEEEGLHLKEKISRRSTLKWLEPMEPTSFEIQTLNGAIQNGGETERLSVGPYGSHAFYNNLLASTMKGVRGLLAEEKRREPLTTPDRRKMWQALASVYFRYLTLFQQLDLIYDQMVQPQKRLVIRRLLDLFLGRLIELQWQLVLCESSEYLYFDELALLEGVLPAQLDLPIPRYYFHDPTPEQRQRDQWFQNVKERERRSKEKEAEIQRKLHLQMADDGGGGGVDPWGSQDYHDEETTMMMQVMERARQGKGRYLIAKFYWEEEMRYRRKKATVIVPRVDEHQAATIVQKLVRGYLARLRVKRARQQEMEFLGMRASLGETVTGKEMRFEKNFYFRMDTSTCKRSEELLEEYMEGKRRTRRAKQKQFEDAQQLIHQKLSTLEGPHMQEKFKQQIRTWMLNVKQATGKFPDIPKAELGGTSLIICGGDTPHESSLQRDTTGAGAGGGEGAPKGSGKKGGKEEGEKKKERKARAKKAGAGEQNPVLDVPKCFAEMKTVNEEYNRYWRGLTMGDNPKEDHDMRHIIREKRQLVATEIREQVDLALKAELDLLKQVLERRRGKKGKKGKGKSKGKGKGKKGKKKKGKDLTPDRTMESLFEELVQQNIIREYPSVRMRDLVASTSFVNGELRSYHTAHPHERKTEERYMPGDAHPLPAFGDVLKAVKDMCILPLGSVQVHRQVPEITKSILLCGPPGSGKKTIVNMMCTELRATLVDLTSTNIVGKYPGKPGLKMMMHLIEKVGRATPPVVVLIDNVERTYMKKVPKTDKSEPKRLKKQLTKFLKTITAEDLILLVGLSSEPWACPFKVIKKDFQRILYIPLPDYGSRFQMWAHSLLGTPTLLHPDVNLTLLTKLSQGWTLGYIGKACQAVLQRHARDVAKQQRERRKDMDPWGYLGNFVVRHTPMGKLLVTMDKLLESLSEYDPVFLEQEKLWNSWWNKTPLQKARLTVMGKSGPGPADPEHKSDKKGKKKKKKK